MGTLIMVAQFMLSLCILIILHECGHFFPAKWFNTKVEKFYLFFDPYFSLFKYKKGDTEYGVGWLPLGGYVKIAGMVDESFDTEALKEPPKEWEFRSKPAWQRLIIMLGGVTVNYILGILIFALLFFKWGEAYIATDDAKYGMVVEEFGKQLGLEDGDLILKVGEKEIEKFEPITVKQEIIFSEATELTVKRNNRTIQLAVPSTLAAEMAKYENQGKGLYQLAYPNVIDSMASDSKALEAGLRVGDRLIGINDNHYPYHLSFVREVQANSGKEVMLDLIRGSDTLTMPAPVSAEGTLGYFAKNVTEYIDISTAEYSLNQSLAKGFHTSNKFIADQVKAFGQMFRGKLNFMDSAGGPISIAQQYGQIWDWKRFWTLTATLSVLLAFINILPIPALDGGHVLFLLWEVITGRKPSDKFLEYATMLGFFLLLLLMVLVFGVDISRLWSN